MWSWLAYDFDNSISVEKILYKAKDIKGGDILVLHDNEKVKERVELLLPQLINIIQNKGLNFSIVK